MLQHCTFHVLEYMCHKNSIHVTNMRTSRKEFLISSIVKSGRADIVVPPQAELITHLYKMDFFHLLYIFDKHNTSLSMQIPAYTFKKFNLIEHLLLLPEISKKLTIPKDVSVFFVLELMDIRDASRSFGCFSESFAQVFLFYVV